MQILPNSMVVVTIGGHDEIVRWWSREYWKGRKFRHDSFDRAYSKRQEILSDIRERGRKRLSGPKTGSPAWLDIQEELMVTTWSRMNLMQHEDEMDGADAKKVAVVLAYEGSWQERLHHWAHRQSHKYWRTANIYQALMYWFHTRVRDWARCEFRLHSLCSTEKIRLGRLKGDGYHGCGIYQKPMKPSRYGIGV